LRDIRFPRARWTDRHHLGRLRISFRSHLGPRPRGSPVTPTRDDASASWLAKDRRATPGKEEFNVREMLRPLRVRAGGEAPQRAACASSAPAQPHGDRARTSTAVLRALVTIETCSSRSLRHRGRVRRRRGERTTSCPSRAALPRQGASTADRRLQCRLRPHFSERPPTRRRL